MKQLKYTPMFEMALEALRDYIIDGAWKPGEVLSHEDIASRLNVSRMPVREAVRLLEQEGFVTVRRNVGVEVLPLSWNDFEEVYQMRQALEALAGRLATPHLTASDHRHLGSLIKRLEEALEKGYEPSATLKLTQEFHTATYRPAGKARLLKTIDTLRYHSARYRAFVVKLPGHSGTLLAEHQRIYEACLRRDGDAVAEAISTHFQHALDIAGAEKGRIVHEVAG